jgi:hypothetical protein
VKVQRGWEVYEDPNRRGSENPIQLREAAHGSGRSDSRASGRANDEGMEELLTEAVNNSEANEHP